MALDHYFRNLVEGRRRGLLELILLTLLQVLSVPYAAVLRLRALAYRSGLFRTRRLPKPVISVGNITAGGTGKTPIVALIARYYINSGKKVAVLSRGYRGTAEGNTGIVSDGKNILMTPAEAGDEPCMLAEKIPGLMVVVGADRYRAGLHAIEFLDPDIFILDDGFQHLRLHRDLNILVMDHARPLGNGRVLPAGLLREPSLAARRADLIIFTRCSDNADKIHFDGIQACHAFHEIVGFVPLAWIETEKVPDLSTLKGVAFAGIADPDSFFDMLGKCGMDITSKICFPDHCRYGEREIEKIISSVEAVNSDYLVTTEKDSVKLVPYLPRLGRIYSAAMEVRIPDMKSLTDRLEILI
jgi:tetraacyldisaccharide 4'-kinase